MHDGGRADVEVLVVDDDLRVRQALVRLLTAWPGFGVVAEAADAESAVRRAEERPPTVALVDVLLPDPDTGLALIGALSHEIGAPVIAISAQSSVRGAALSAGAVSFVDKGISPELLVGVLAEAAAESPAGGPRQSRQICEPPGGVS